MEKYSKFNEYGILNVESRENVEYPLQLARTPRAERTRRAAEALGWVGLEEKAGRRPNQLSGGEKQRVAVARALVHRPRLGLADEPTANLDTQTGARIVSLLTELNQRLGVTFVIATHDPNLISRHVVVHRVLRWTNVHQSHEISAILFT